MTPASVMRFKHTRRPGFLFGLIDFCTVGLFFLFYMPQSGLQEELDCILGRKTMPYWKAYLLGIPTLFIYPLVWMARIAEELKAKAVELGIEGPYTSWWHMFGWNTFGVLLLGPGFATGRFFSTLNRIESRLNGSECPEYFLRATILRLASPRGKNTPFCPRCTEYDPGRIGNAYRL